MAKATCSLEVSPEQAKTLDALKKKGRPNTWSSPSPERKKKALRLYLKSGSKSHVCSKLHMGRNTLNDIIQEAGKNKKGVL